MISITNSNSIFNDPNIRKFKSDFIQEILVVKKLTKKKPNGSESNSTDVCLLDAKTKGKDGETNHVLLRCK